jgi:potassium efflux system protein
LIGIDLTTITVFAGALGVGIGFGLQTIANNFISGIILLIERPIRTGDAISISDKYSGRVTQIGIRSLIVKTWDHEEVIIPNSELITSVFSNWTHSSSVRRTTIYISASYNSNPHLVIRVLAEALNDTVGILAEPKFAIHFWEFADSALIFRIDYYFDMNSSELGTSVKSRLLLEIWDHFKREKIEIPFPQRDIYVKSFPSASKTELREKSIITPLEPRY